MTNLPPSAFEPVVNNVSSAFARLDSRVQRWIWEQNWTELRDIQEATIHAVLDGGTDVILSAPTASGKTEAAFLPICSQIVNAVEPGMRVLYIGPLKALIDDQFARLDGLCERLDIPVHRWHGDISAYRKTSLRQNPSGILLITPESLEALFVLHGSQIGRVFASLAYVVIDELHAFLGTERGRQVQSLLHRLETCVQRTIPRIGLSATLSDMRLTAEHLRPGASERVQIITSQAAKQELKIQLRGYRFAPTNNTDEAWQEAQELVNTDIAKHLYAALSGSDNLIFPNTRANVELYADLLRRICESNGTSCAFLPHHGNLSRPLRDEAETRLKDKTWPVSLICTTTLEMGIDVGSVHSVAQISVPPSVANLRQRIGRSGRRGNPAVARIYITESNIYNSMFPQASLRANLVQTIAIIQLMLAGWVEPPPADAPHPSTLVQQTLSYIAQRNGATAMELWQVLCQSGPFSSISQRTYAEFLRTIARHNLLMQSTDGTLLLGTRGERIVNNYHFYAAFTHSEEFRLVANGQTLGTMPITSLPYPDQYLVFNGQRWQVVEVDTATKTILLIAAKELGVPPFEGSVGLIHDRVRQEMFHIYTSTEVPIYLDAVARELLAEGRANFARYELDRKFLIEYRNDTILFCWRSDRVLNTIAAQLRIAGYDVALEDHAVTIQNVSPEQIAEAIRQLAAQGPADALTLISEHTSLLPEKYDQYLPESLLQAQIAIRSLDVQGAWETLSSMLRTM